MKQFKLSSKRKSSGQVVVLLIIVLALLGCAWWWMNSNKQNSANDGRGKRLCKRSVPENCRPARYQFLQFAAQSTGPHEFSSFGATGVHERDCEARSAGPPSGRSR